VGREEGLRGRSVVNLDNVHVIPRESLRDRLGRLPANRHHEVKRALGYALDCPELKSL